MGWKTVIFIIISALVFKQIWTVYKILHTDKVVKNHAPGPCFNVKHVNDGAEDMMYLEDGLVIMTSGLVYGAMKNKPAFAYKRGKVLAFDMKNPEENIKEISVKGLDMENFNPHGISVFKSPSSGHYTVFIVNHPKNLPHDTVEIFDFNKDDMELNLKDTVKNDLFGQINDLVALSETTFYVTRMAYFKHPKLALIELLSTVKLGAILYYDGANVHILESGLLQPNGIQFSKDKSQLFVASEVSKMLVYDVGPNHQLTRAAEIYLDGPPDNIDVDERGDIWIGMHPVGWEILRFLEMPGKYTAPSQVLHLTWDGKNATSIEEVYADDGHRIWGSTIAIYRHGGVLIGSVNSQLIYCKVLHLGI